MDTAYKWGKRKARQYLGKGAVLTKDRRTGAYKVGVRRYIGRGYARQSYVWMFYGNTITEVVQSLIGSTTRRA